MTSPAPDNYRTADKTPTPAHAADLLGRLDPADVSRRPWVEAYADNEGRLSKVRKAILDAAAAGTMIDPVDLARLVAGDTAAETVARYGRAAQAARS